MRRICLLFSCLLLIYSTVFSQTVPSGFSVSPVSSGWGSPVGTAFTSDGQRLFVWEKSGRVYVCNRDGSGNYIKQAQAVLDISEEVLNWRDHGLLGFALDPAFASNGNIYLLYVVDRHYLMNFGTGAYNPATTTENAATIGRVTRYQTGMSGGNLIANPASRFVLLGETRFTGVPILYESHSVGGLAFAADGTLLISSGDGASYNTTDPGGIGHTYFSQAMDDDIITDEENVGAFRSQLLNSHGGKLLRIDPVSGNGVSSNPFYDAGSPRAAKSKVWAMGFRNPFRIAVRPGSGSTNPSSGDIGEVYVGDVGWNVWEELNIIRQPGMNCGWPLFEGQTTLTSYYNLNTANPQEPNPLNGIAGCTQPFFRFKDLLKQATADEITTVYNSCNTGTPIASGNRYFHRRPAIAWRHGSNSTLVGTFSGNNATTAEIGTPASAVTGTPFQGNCAVAGAWYTGSSFPTAYQNTFFMGDLGGRWIKSVAIDFTDKVTRVENFGSNFVNLVSISQHPITGELITVEMGDGGTAPRINRIAYGGNQPPVAKIVSDKIFGPGPLTVNFNGNTSFDSNGSVASYLWNFGNGNTSTAISPTAIFSATPGTPTMFTVTLTVTDNQGATGTASIVISVNNTPPVVNITSPIKNSTYAANGQDIVYNCTATVTDAEHTDAQLQYAWQTFLCHNNHRHSDPIDNAKITSTTIAGVGCNEDEYYWLVELTVTDAAGLSTKDSSKIFPFCATTLNGSVTLQARPAAPHPRWQVPLKVDLYLDGTNVTTPTFTYDVSTDQSGNYTINNIPPGTYTIAVKNPITLKRRLYTQRIQMGTNNISFGLLRSGDGDNNNFISLLDLSLLINSFNKIPGEPGYDIRADFNGDGIISLLDLSLLINNYNTIGENP